MKCVRLLHMGMGALIALTWLSRLDTEILGFYRQYPDMKAKPKTIYVNRQPDVHLVSLRRRVAVLLEAGLVDRDEEGYYTITETGMDLIEDDVSQEELEDLNPNPRKYGPSSD